MAFIYNANTKSYNYTPKDNPKDRVDVEIGDAENSSQFFPQVKIKRWDNEVNASIRLNYSNIPGNISYDDDGTTIHWRKGQWEAWFYHRDDVEDGGFEFEVHIPKKPPVNYLEFTVNTKDLDWFYQPALTQQEIDEGSARPENVVGSYAVYHKTKGVVNNEAGMEYKTGKAFHIYRPHVVDANNNSTWGTLSLNEATGILTISVDQTWLNNAVYPVIVDPTLGFSSVGGTAFGLAGNTVRLAVTHTATENGTVTSISAYDENTTARGAARGVLYEADLSFVDCGTANAGGTDSGWIVYDMDDQSIVNGTAYGIGLYIDGTFTSGRYDSVAGFDVHRDNLTYHATNDPADPFVTASTLANYKWSIYSTYTATGGGTSVKDIIQAGIIPFAR